ncbi:hypothetical protein BH10PSE2_BH10PSE2_07350 [soil metagenome]
MKLFFASALSALALAGAASAQDARIAFGDLDMSSTAGAAAFDARVEAAARDLCRSVQTTGSRIDHSESCRAAVRAEARSQLSPSARESYAVARAAMAV